MRLARGFTLIELMVAVAVIGILAGIAVPLYSQYVVVAKRSAAKAVLMDVYALQEQFLAQQQVGFGEYNAAASPPINDLNLFVPAEVAADYVISVTAADVVRASFTVPGFVATATPRAGSAQAAAGEPTLAINQFGLKTPPGFW